MTTITIIWLAIGLAMDCFAVSISRGIMAKRFYWDHSLVMALLFGLFQGGMPLLSYLLGSCFTEAISAVDHWIALILLGLVGGKSIYESLTHKDAAALTDSDPQAHHQLFRPGDLLLLAVATSIDALAAGILFVPCPEVLWAGVGIIALTSFAFSLIGMFIGASAGSRFKLNVNLLGGIILVLIGVKIWVEHIFFN